MAKLTKVRLIENDDYDHHYFKTLIDKYPHNKAIFENKRRRLGRVFKVSEHFELCNRIRLVTGKGEQLEGQYDVNLFRAIQLKMSDNIVRYADQMYEGHRNRDTHSTNVEYACVAPNVYNTDSLTQMYADYPKKKRKDSDTIKWSTSKYCFAEFRTWGRKDEFYTKYTKIIGRHRLCMDEDIFMSLVEAAYKEGWLSPNAQVWLVDDEANGKRVEYMIPLEQPFNLSYYYFQLSFLRMAREYTGTLKVAYSLMKRFKVSFTLAMVIAYQENPNHYSLHIAYPVARYAGIFTACAIGQYITVLRDPKRNKDKRYYNTTDSIEGIANELRDEDGGEHNVHITGKNVKQLNNLVLEEVYNG